MHLVLCQSLPGPFPLPAGLTNPRGREPPALVHLLPEKPARAACILDACQAGQTRRTYCRHPGRRLRRAVQQSAMMLPYRPWHAGKHRPKHRVCRRPGRSARNAECGSEGCANRCDCRVLPRQCQRVKQRLRKVPKPSSYEAELSRIARPAQDNPAWKGIGTRIAPWVTGSAPAHDAVGGKVPSSMSDCRKARACGLLMQSTRIVARPIGVRPTRSGPAH
jgi:hypothetical protein